MAAPSPLLRILVRCPRLFLFLLRGFYPGTPGLELGLIPNRFTQSEILDYGSRNGGWRVSLTMSTRALRAGPAWVFDALFLPWMLC